jgi:hypothetical protein
MQKDMVKDVNPRLKPFEHVKGPSGKANNTYTMSRFRSICAPDGGFHDVERRPWQETVDEDGQIHLRKSRRITES